MAIELTKDHRDEAVASIQLYSGENMEESMGNIAAGALLDFILEEIGPCIYNKAISDMQDRLQMRIMDLDVELQHEEFPHSRRRDSTQSKN